MVGAGLIHGLITGKPSESDKDICTNLTHIFNKIFKGFSLVNSGFTELAKYIDKTPLGHLGKILSDIYMSTTPAADDDDDSDDVDYNVVLDQGNEGDDAPVTCCCKQST